jgi:tetratricopeptide (TPR) repeat protein
MSLSSALWNLGERHGRRLTWIYLGSLVLLLLVLGVPYIRQRVFWRVERALVAREARWADRVTTGEALLAAGRLEEAQAYLEQLDRRFPARNVRHALDKERERLLLALGNTYAALGRRNMALTTFTNLAAFDSRNWKNHAALAAAHTRLDPNWSTPDEAGLALVEVLRINPNQLEAVTDLATFYFEKPDFRSLVATMDTYLQADLYIMSFPALDTSRVEQVLDVDGTWHRVTLHYPEAPAAPSRLSLPTGGYSAEVRSVTLQPALLVGRSPAEPIVLLPEPAWTGDSVSSPRPGLFQSAGSETAIHVPLPPDLPPIATVEVELRLFKPMNDDLWALARRAYRSILRPQGLDSAAQLLFPRAEAR